ncbi:MAG: YlxR family protein [Deltaproteobacteria bacterium]|nr:YlxR family protein [Deltaproteobacteria bacterium]
MACHAQHDRRRLLRLVVNAGSFEVDRAQRMPGRGWYVCPSERCLERAFGGRRKWTRGGPTIGEADALRLRRELEDVIAETWRSEPRD